MKDTIQTIRRSSRLFVSGTLLSRLTGMLRDMSMAYLFGTHRSIAAFMVAFRLAHLFRRLFGEGALQSAFIPQFEALRHQSEQRALTLFRDLSLLLAIFLILLVGGGCAFLGISLQWGDLHPGHQEILYLTLIMLPSLLFICLFGLNTAFLQCEKSYFTPGVAPAVFNGVWILTIFILRRMPADEAMPWLSLGIVIACLCQWLLTLPQTWKSLKNTLFLPWQMLSNDLRQLGKPLALGIMGVAASQINSAMDTLFARLAEPEGPAFLWYAIRIQQLPLALFGIAVAGAALPPLSRALKAGQWEKYHHFLHDALYRTWIFMLPLTAAVFIMGEASVNLLYGRGHFGPEEVLKTTHCLWAYGIGLIPSALVLVLAPASYAQNNYTLPAYASFAAMLSNVFLNTLFMIKFHWGAISIAIATSISAWLNCYLLGWNLFRSGVSLFSWAFFKQTLPTMFATGVAFCGTYKMRIFLEETSFFSKREFSCGSISTQFSFLACQALPFAILFFLCYLICYVSERLFCTHIQQV